MTAGHGGEAPGDLPGLGRRLGGAVRDPRRAPRGHRPPRGLRQTRRRRPLGLDYRYDVASITKTATAILFSRFLDQGLLGLDDPVSTVFPDYPRDPAHVPTFRQCLTHMSGLSGHGDWGGARNPHLENVVLNGIDANEPGKVYDYSGIGFELAAKAMEIVAGRSARTCTTSTCSSRWAWATSPWSSPARACGSPPASSAALAQWVANRGSYGELEFISPETFEELLPEPLRPLRYPGVAEEEGIGMHWMRHARPGAPAGSTRPRGPVLRPAHCSATARCRRASSSPTWHGGWSSPRSARRPARDTATGRSSSSRPSPTASWRRATALRVTRVPLRDARAGRGLRPTPPGWGSPGGVPHAAAPRPRPPDQMVPMDPIRRDRASAVGTDSGAAGSVQYSGADASGRD